MPEDIAQRLLQDDSLRAPHRRALLARRNRSPRFSAERFGRMIFSKGFERQHSEADATRPESLRATEEPDSLAIFWERRRPCLQASQVGTLAGKGACAPRIAIFVLSARSWFLLRSG